MSFVGTTHNFGLFLGLIISGYFSDKFGRKIVIIFIMITGGIFPVIRSFSQNYISYIILEFIDALCEGGSYAAVYVYGKNVPI